MSGQLWLSSGSAVLSDAVDLDNASGFLATDFKLAAYDPENPPNPPRRALTIPGTILGGPPGLRSMDVVADIKGQINKKLRQAALSLGNGDAWLAGPVCVAEALQGVSNITYWDVVYGSLEEVERGFGWMDVILHLEVLPFGRGERETAVITTLSSLYHTYYVGNVLGDVPALTTLTLVDTTGGGGCINEVRAGIASTPDLAASDCTLAIEAVPAWPTVQAVSVGAASAGTYMLSFGGQTTGAIARNASAAALQTALTGLSSIGVGGVTVTGDGSTATPWLVTFASALATAAQPLMTGVGTGLTGGALTIRMLTGASFSDATASGGTCVRVGQTDNQQLQAAAFLIGPTSGALQFGDLDPLIRVREVPGVAGGLVFGPPVIDAVYASSGGGDGTLSGQTATVCMTNFDVSGNESLPSASQQLILPIDAAVTLQVAWHQEIVPTSSRVYCQFSTGGWLYSNTGTPGTTTPRGTTLGIGSTSAGLTAGSLPTASAAATYGTQLVASPAVATPNPATADYVLGRGSQTSLGNGRWEWLPQQTLRLSPAFAAEYGTEPHWLVALDALTANPFAYTAPSQFDIDYAVFFPHGRAPYLHAWHSTFDMAVPRTWICDYRRDDRQRVIFTDGTNIQGQASVEGSFQLGPGGNIFVLALGKQLGESDVALSCTLSIQYTPLYVHSRGVGI